MKSTFNILYHENRASVFECGSPIPLFGLRVRNKHKPPNPAIAGKIS